MADHDDQDAAVAMAQMMGFSSFGNQNPSKKRKLSPGASSARQQNQHPPATSANAVEIGLRDEKDNTRNSSSHHEGAGVEGGASTEEATRPAHPAGLPARPPPQHQGQRFSRGGPARQNHRAPGGGSWHHGGGDGGDGAGYDDDLANANPWEALETRMGLEPRGAWLPRPARAGAAPTAAAAAAPEQQQQQQQQQAGDMKEQPPGTDQENEQEEKEG